jgi:hypothetical protein
MRLSCTPNAIEGVQYRDHHISTRERIISAELKKLELRKSRQQAERSAEAQTGISQSGNQREISSSQGSSPPT